MQILKKKVFILLLFSGIYMHMNKGGRTRGLGGLNVVKGGVAPPT